MEERKLGAGLRGCTQEYEGKPQGVTLSETPHAHI